MNVLLLTLILLQAPVSGGNIQGLVSHVGAGPQSPVLGARVELAGGPQGTIVTRSDGNGEFVFENVPAGRYQLSVKKEGYLRQEYGQRTPGGAGTTITVEGGTKLQGIHFQLQPASTFAGSIRNEENVPVANILVQALRRTYGVRGNRTISLFASTLTDDLGAYRLYWLDPGNYYVNASYLPQLPTPVNANEDAPRAAYAPTYYPGVADALEARAVRIEGERPFTGIDFKLDRAPAVKIRGTIYSILTRSPVPSTVTLMSPDESGSTSRYTILTDDKGVFEMKGVNPGSYVISAKTVSGDGQIGFSTIKVAPVDYPKADVVLGPGMTVNVRLTGASPASADMRSTRVSLLPLESYIPTPQPGAVQSDGTLFVANVQPGDYLLSVAGLPEDGYVRGARSDQRDVLEEFVRVGYESQTTIDVQLAFDGGQISGTVFDAAATAVLVPEKTRRHRPDQYRVTTADQSGTFSIRGIPPGDYKLFAWESIEPNAYVNAEFLMNYEESGTPVHIAPGAKIPAQIRAIPAP